MTRDVTTRAKEYFGVVSGRRPRGGLAEELIAVAAAWFLKPTRYAIWETRQVPSIAVHGDTGPRQD